MIQAHTDVYPPASKFGLVGADSKERLDGLKGHAARSRVVDLLASARSRSRLSKLQSGMEKSRGG